MPHANGTLFIVLLTNSIGGSERRVLEMFARNSVKLRNVRLIMTTGIFQEATALKYRIERSKILLLKRKRFVLQMIEILLIAIRAGPRANFHYFINFPPLMHWILRQKVILSYTDTSLFPSYLSKPKIKYLFWWGTVECKILDCLDPQVYKKLVNKSWIRSKISLTNSSFIDLDQCVAAQQVGDKVLFCGRIDQGDPKGILKYARLIPDINRILLEKDIANPEFVIIGRGSLVGEVKQILAQPEFKTINIRFDAANFNPMPIMAQSKVILSLQGASNYPSRSLLEGMACGALPIITDTGDSRRMVTDEFGYFVPRHYEAADLADAIAKILKLSASDFAERTKRARAFLRKEFNPENHVSYYSDLYSRLASS